jgi:Tol biopolymer transport system component
VPITTETLTKTVDQLDQHYKCYVCNLGIRPDTRRMVFASRTGSRDIVHDRYLCIAV